MALTSLLHDNLMQCHAYNAKLLCLACIEDVAQIQYPHSFYMYIFFCSDIICDVILGSIEGEFSGY